jgi:hypothetical protein
MGWRPRYDGSYPLPQLPQGLADARAMPAITLNVIASLSRRIPPTRLTICLIFFDASNEPQEWKSAPPCSGTNTSSDRRARFPRRLHARGKS